jgi:hypothetical protein
VDFYYAFEEVKLGRIYERNVRYTTEFLLVLSKGKKLISCLFFDGANIETIFLNKQIWDTEKYELLVNKEEIEERRRDFIDFIFGD